jgi:hypothetical protein
VDKDRSSNDEQESSSSDDTESEILSSEESFEELFDTEEDEETPSAWKAKENKKKSQEPCASSVKQSQFNFIYPKSNLTDIEFIFVFQIISQKLKIPKNKRNTFLQFIKTLLPTSKNIPASYSILEAKLKKCFRHSKKSFKICSRCYEIYNKQCVDPNCKNEKKKLYIDAMVFDFKTQLKNILERNWKSIKEYKGMKQMKNKTKYSIFCFLTFNLRVSKR